MLPSSPLPSLYFLSFSTTTFLPPLFPSSSSFLTLYLLSLTSRHDGRRVRVIDLTRVAAAGLEGLDDPQGVLVGDFAEDDVFAVEPAGDDGGDEELGSVAEVVVLVIWAHCDGEVGRWGRAR